MYIYIYLGELDECFIRTARITSECANCKSEAVDIASQTCFICLQNGISQPHIINPIYLCAERLCKKKALPLREVILKTDPKEVCPICYEDDFKFFVQLSACKHKVCIDCFKQDALFKLNNKLVTYDKELNRYTLKCFEGSCSELATDIHIISLIGKHHYNRFKEFALTSMLMVNDSSFICPLSRCGEALIGIDPDIEKQKIIECPK